MPASPLLRSGDLNLQAAVFKAATEAATPNA